MQNPSSQRRWRNHPPVRERDTHRARWLWGMLVGILLALAPAGFYLLNQNQCLKGAYQVQQLRNESERLIDEERRLDVARARLESLSRIEDWARRDEGMTRPTSDDVIVVRRGAGQDVNLLARRIE